MTLCLRGTSLFVAAVVFAGSMAGAQAAHADGPVTISATGPASVPATVGRASATSWATFAITDSSATATSLYICYVKPDGKQRECDSVDLTASTYGDGNPQVTGGTGSYQYRARIAYNSISKGECWSAYFAKQPYRIAVSVRNGADVELASATHSYKVACTGIASAASGPKRLGRVSKVVRGLGPMIG